MRVVNCNHNTVLNSLSLIIEGSECDFIQMGNNATYFGSTEKNYFGLERYGEHKEGNF